MKSEFQRYGLKEFRVLTGLLEILGGFGVLIGLFYPPLLSLASLGLFVLMIAGVYTRVRVGDSLLLTLPALALLLINGFVFSLSLPELFAHWG
jgi:hypothetical protein